MLFFFFFPQIQCDTRIFMHSNIYHISISSTDSTEFFFNTYFAGSQEVF